MARWLIPLALCSFLATPALAGPGLSVAPALARPALSLPVMAAFPAGEAAPAERLVLPAQPRRAMVQPIAAPRQTRQNYGPFRVVGADRAELRGATDAASPQQFAAMLADHPGLARLDLTWSPGTHDDRANLKLGRMIRAAGLATHVPRGGSVRSGAVELFLAGTERSVEDGAEFAVHSWRDPQGREADDFALDAAPNRAYLDYYRDMGMEAATARRFYAVTNSVPHSGVLWLGAAEMRRWAGAASTANEGRRRQPMALDAASAGPLVASGRTAAPVALALLDRTLLERTGRSVSRATPRLDSGRHKA